jgi:MFS family permease
MFFMSGPEPLFSFPHTIAFTIMGLSLLGVGVAFSMVPSIPEFIAVGKILFPKHHSTVGDMASGLFNASYSAGALVGPILGGVLDEKFGFPRAETIYGMVNLAYLMVYLTVGEGILAFASKGKKKETDKVQDLEKEVGLTDKLIDKDDQATLVKDSSWEDGSGARANAFDEEGATIVITGDLDEVKKVVSV